MNKVQPTWCTVPFANRPFDVSKRFTLCLLASIRVATRNLSLFSHSTAPRHSVMSTSPFAGRAHSPRLTSPTQSIEPEPWVDIAALAKHIGFGYQATRRMVLDGKIPGKPFLNGSRTLWRFQLSAVDAALTQGQR